MKPEEALSLIQNILVQLKLSFQEHQQLQQAVMSIDQALKDKCEDKPQTS